MRPIRDAFDLTPATIRQQKASIAALTNYLVASILLCGLLSGVAMMRLQERKQQTAALRSLMNEAVPVREMRLEALRLQQRNQQLAKVIDAVASAKPHDSLLQAFADATTRLGRSGVTPKEMHLRLAIESSGSTSPNHWAEPKLKMTVEANDGLLASQAEELLNQTARFTNVEVQGLVKVGDVTRSEVVAIPLAEVLLP